MISGTGSWPARVTKYLSASSQAEKEKSAGEPACLASAAPNIRSDSASVASAASKKKPPVAAASDRSR